MIYEYIIQKFFLWKGQGFPFPPPRAGRAAILVQVEAQGHVGAGGLALVISLEESERHLPRASKGLGERKFGDKCLFFRFK